MKRLSVTLLLLSIAACGSLSSFTPEEDGGCAECPSDAPDSGDGADAGEPVTDGGTEPDGGDDGGADAGEVDAGPLPALSWGQMAFTSTDSMYDVHGTGPDNVYFAGGDGKIRRFNGQSLEVAYDRNTTEDFVGIWVSSDGAVFAASNSGTLVWCLKDCTEQDAFFIHSVSKVYFSGICGKDANTVYAVGNNAQVAGQMVQLDGSGWAEPVPTNSVYNKGCTVSDDGQMFLAARSQMVRFDGVAFMPEPVNYPDWTQAQIQDQLWYDVWASGDTVLATGSRRAVIRRQPSGAWAVVYDPSLNESNYALAGSGPTDVYAAGVTGTSSNLTRFDGAWKAQPDGARPPLWIVGLWAADAKTYYAVGRLPSQSAGAIFRGTR
jgi:hypothetical protein